MSETQVVTVKQGAGMTAGIIACVLAVLGILFLSIVFVPIAAVVALLGTLTAVANKNTAAIGVNILAWVLIVAGIATSPFFMMVIGGMFA